MSVAQENFSYHLPEETQREIQRPKRQLSRRAVRRGKIMLIGCIFSMFVMGLTVAYYYAQVAAVGYQISQLQNELAILQTEQEYLESQANQLLSLQRVEAIATTKLGMVKPNPNEVVLVAALPKNSQEQQKNQVQQQEPQASTSTTAPEKDNHDNKVAEKSPVIEAFVDLVNRWEKKL